MFLTLTTVIASCHEIWINDYEEAKKKAVQESKDLLINFTSHDSCAYCVKLDKEVFEKELFKSEAQKHFILVRLDFPLRESNQDQAVKMQHDSLRKQYMVREIPAILLCDAEGRPYAKTGYKPGGPENFIKDLEELRKKRIQRDNAFAEAEASDGIKKAKIYVGALMDTQVSEEALNSFYADVLEKIKVADPDDVTGFITKQNEASRYAELENKFEAEHKNDKIIPHLEFCLEQKWSVKNQQGIYLMLATAYLERGKKDKAITNLTRGIELDGSTREAHDLKAFKSILLTEPNANDQ